MGQSRCYPNVVFPTSSLSDSSSYLKQRMEGDCQIPPDLVGLALPRLRLNDHTLEENLPSPPAQAENGGRQPHPGRAPSAMNLGALDALPLELLQIILSQLDIRTLTGFQIVNRRAAELVSSLPKYSAINRYFRTAIRAILSIHTGRWITCEALYAKLCTAKCDYCGDFGGYLYLVTCKRVCFICFTHEKPYLPLSPTYASRKFGLDRQLVNSLPRIKVLPGVYSPNAKKVTATVLVDYEASLDAGIERHGSSAAMERYVSKREAEKVEAYHSRQATLRPTSRTRHPRLVDPLDKQTRNPLRFVAIVRAPWLKKDLREVEWGMYCSGCGKFSPPLHWRRQFTVASFREHLRECGRIEDGRHHLD